MTFEHAAVLAKTINGLVAAIELLLKLRRVVKRRAGK